MGHCFFVALSHAFCYVHPYVYFLVLVCIFHPDFHRRGPKQVFHFVESHANKLTHGGPMYVWNIFIKKSTEPIYLGLNFVKIMLPLSSFLTLLAVLFSWKTVNEALPNNLNNWYYLSCFGMLGRQRLLNKPNLIAYWGLRVRSGKTFITSLSFKQIPNIC